MADFWSWLHYWQDLAGAVVGGAMALVVVLLWEGILLPRRTRRDVARSIAAETSLNMQLMAGQIRGDINGSIPGDFWLDRRVFDSIAEKVGELRQPALGTVLLLYTRVDYLNRIASQTYPEFLESYRAARGTPQEQERRRELDAASEAFYRLLESTLDTANISQRHLWNSAERGWRWWRREPFKTKSMDEIDESVQRVLAQREQNLRRRPPRS